VNVNLRLPEIERIVWELLEERPCQRPTMEEVAAVRGCRARDIRRATERIQRILGPIGYCATFRDALTYSCLTYARMLIQRGTKIEAAMRLAGFHNKTNFNRQFSRFLTCEPGELPHRRTA
jgi:methylphosphotriester-DNA--protein-cysteine methyltransferase